MKKKFALLMTAIVSTSALALAGCKTNIKWIDEKICKHEYEFVEITLEPTCTEEGERLMECVDCGKQKTEVMEKIAHEEVVTPGKDPTCMEDGYTEKIVCNICREVLQAPKDRPALGHTDSNGDCKCDTCNFAQEEFASMGEHIVGKTYRIYPGPGYKNEEAYGLYPELRVDVRLLDGTEKTLYVTVCGEKFSSTNVSGFIFEHSIARDASGNVLYRDVTFKAGEYTALDGSGQELSFVIDETSYISNVTNAPGSNMNNGYVKLLSPIVSEA